MFGWGAGGPSPGRKTRQSVLFKSSAGLSPDPVACWGSPRQLSVQDLEGTEEKTAG